MTIQIDGVGTVNKGAELLLFAILQEIEKRYPSATIIYNDSTFMESNQQASYFHSKLRIEKPFYMRSCFTSFLRRFHVFGFFEKFFPQVNLIKTLNSFYFPHVDVLLNAAGYLFSDKFNLGQIYVNDLKSKLSKLKNQHVQIIYLPQAFGPIEKKGTKDAVKVLNSYADLVFAREKISYEYLIREGFNLDKLFLYPDFTSLVKGVCPSQYLYLKAYVCLIPNMKMVEKGLASYDEYMCFWQNVIELAHKNGRKTFVLNHEGWGDAKICNDISRRFDIPLVSGLNAIDTKGVISESYLVISSRFHGVASALSSHVPCLATSWSHKYELLFNDYKQSDCILNISSTDKNEERITKLLNIKENQCCRDNLRSQAEKKRLLSQNMWNIVWNKIEKR